MIKLSPALYGMAGLGVCLLLMGGWVLALKADVATHAATIATLERDMARAEAQARHDKQRAEDSARARIEMARQSYAQELLHAQVEHARTVAGLRDGSKRLRWSLECPPAADMPEAPAGTAGTADPADLRAEDARATVAAAIALADQCDADLRAAHAVIEADRQ